MITIIHIHYYYLVIFVLVDAVYFNLVLRNKENMATLKKCNRDNIYILIYKLPCVYIDDCDIYQLVTRKKEQRATSAIVPKPGTIHILQQHNVVSGSKYTEHSVIIFPVLRLTMCFVPYTCDYFEIYSDRATRFCDKC